MNSPANLRESIAPGRVDSRRTSTLTHSVASGAAAGRRVSWIIPTDGFRLALFFLVVFSISRIHQHFGFLGALRPGLTLLGLAIVLAAAKPSALGTSAFSTWPARIVMALVVVACLSVPFGLSMGNSGKFLLDAYFRVLAVYLLLALSLRGPRDLSTFVWAFVISVAVLSWMAIFVFDLGQGMGSQMRLGDLYMYDANDLGVLLLIGVPLTLVVVDTSGRAGRLFGIVLLFAIGVAIARSGSRGSFVGLLGLGAAFLVWARHISIAKRLGAVAAVVFALMLAAPPGYWEQMNTLKSPKEDYNWQSETGRKQLAERGFGYMLRYPLTGVGVNNFTKAEWQISSMAQEIGRTQGIRGKAAHNTWVQVGAELGVTGLVLWCCLIFGTIWIVGRTRRQLPRSWKRGPPNLRLLYSLSFYLPLAVWAFAVPSTFVSHAYMDPMYYLATICAGYLVAVRKARRDERGIGNGKDTAGRA